MTIPFIDLKSQYQQNKSALDECIQRVLKHGQYIMGPEVFELEQALADKINVKHALACSSGTDALLLPLLDKNLEKTDAIFTSPFTFFASAEAISLAGATPVFVDIDPDTYNICPKSLEIAVEELSENGNLVPKGVMPVDLFGLAADFDAINKIAEKYSLFVIEDAAQSFGAKYKDRKAGSLADIGATSFYPAKPLGCYGDGGAVFTDDTNIYERLVSLRVHGQGKSGDKYDNVRIGLNARMDTIQAAILLEKLKIYDDEILARDKIANQYTELLSGMLKTPIIAKGTGSVWAQYSVQSPHRDRIRSALQAHGIPTAVFYPIPIHLSTAYKHLGYQLGDFPISEQVSTQIFSLPMHPYLNTDELEKIVEIVASAITE